jgi:release factor glutamine methyltransferase
MLGRSEALIALGEALARAGYRFGTVTPLTHARVLARRGRDATARDVRDVFGWSLPYEPRVVPPELAEWMRQAEVIETLPSGLERSRVRFSTLEVRGQAHIFAHSAYPTLDEDAVFFGPDTVRFAHLLEQTARRCRRALDLGTGSGAGGVLMAEHAEHVVMTDVNQRALDFAAINARLGGVARASFVCGDLYAAAEGSFDWIAANPPYLVDPRKRAYRDGGGSRGLDLAVRIVREGVAKLSDEGRLVLYTGVPILDGGRDPLREAIAPTLTAEAGRVRCSYRELDPDVFGEELEREEYADIERIAVVAVVIDRV